MARAFVDAESLQKQIREVHELSLREQQKTGRLKKSIERGEAALDRRTREQEAQRPFSREQESGCALILKKGRDHRPGDSFEESVPSDILF